MEKPIIIYCGNINATLFNLANYSMVRVSKLSSFLCIIIALRGESMKKIIIAISVLMLLMIVIFLNKLITYKTFDFPSFFCAIALSIGLMSLQSYRKQDSKQGEN